jgi:hypothetical protein
MTKRFRFPTIASAILIAIAAAPGHARQGGDLGLGFIAGDPSGLSGKIWLGDNNALDLIAGFSAQNDWIRLHADYVWHEFSLFPVRAGQLPLYYGMGLWTAIAKHAPALGARGVVGIEYLFPSAPLDVFLELGPGASILPETEFGITGGLGMRFFF